MSLKKIAQLAGVSPSTVSRVVNDHPNVARETVESVRRAMQELEVVPWSLARRPRRTNEVSGIAFFVFGTNGEAPAPAFERLLSGVSSAAAQHDLSLTFSFVSDPAHLPPRLAERKIGGLLLHGENPSRAVQARLRALPTVWLMANRQRPDWGDQVLPDNSAIGEMAADYLLRRGHRRVAYLGAGGGTWGMEIRSLAFARAAADGGARVDVLKAGEDQRGELWNDDGLLHAGRTLVERLMGLAPRPTGLFVSEDRLLPVIDAALTAHGVVVAGRGGDVELISCNNERPHLARLRNAPAAEIDIRVESIGRRGVEQLIWRLRNPRAAERIRTMVEPVLVEPIPLKPAAVELRAAPPIGA